MIEDDVVAPVAASAQSQNSGRNDFGTRPTDVWRPTMSLSMRNDSSAARSHLPHARSPGLHVRNTRYLYALTSATPPSQGARTGPTLSNFSFCICQVSNKSFLARCDNVQTSHMKKYFEFRARDND